MVIFLHLGYASQRFIFQSALNLRFSCLIFHISEDEVFGRLKFVAPIRFLKQTLVTKILISNVRFHQKNANFTIGGRFSKKMRHGQKLHSKMCAMFKGAISKKGCYGEKIWIQSSSHISTKVFISHQDL